MMTNPKPVKMWAPFHPEYGMALGQLKHTRKLAQKYNCQHAGKSWDKCEAEGYRCIRVTITPDPESEK